MASDTATNDWLNDAAEADQTSAGKLNDTEIQRLVSLSRDASYQQTERVPVKTIEAFEPKSLVSIAMAAQRRREAEMRTAAAAGAQVSDNSQIAADDEIGTHQAEAFQEDKAAEVPADEPVQSAALDPNNAVGQGRAEDIDIATPENEAGLSTGELPSESALEKEQAPNLDYDAGHTAGIEEGRRIGHQEGHAEGLEEGKAAGRAEASAQLERAIQAFEAATEKLIALTEIDSADLADSINTAIMSLASERAGQAIIDLPTAFADRIEALLATVHAVAGEPLIRLNAADFASIKPLVETRERLKNCRFVADASLASGDLKVSVGSIGIDDVLNAIPAVQEEVALENVGADDLSLAVSSSSDDNGEEQQDA